jgi:hypothetical protein
VTPVTAVKHAAAEALARLELDRQEGKSVAYDMDTLRRVIESPTILTLLSATLGERHRPAPL